MRKIAAVIWILLYPILSVVAEAQVELDLKLDREYYLAQQENPVYLKASIRAVGEVDKESQLPINLALVVDRSGSMAGPNIEYARHALMETLSRLSEKDIVSLITYGSEVNTIFGAQPLEGLPNRNILIQQIEAEGGSAQHEALNVAAAQLRRNLKEGSINRLVYMTDGQATSGPRERDDFIRLSESFSREGISISTIGLGEAFDEDLLKQMAEIGGGNFYFANAGNALLGAFLQEVQRLNTVVANNVSVVIRFTSGIKPEEIMGRTGEISGRTVSIPLGQLLNNESAFVLVSATIPARNTFSNQLNVAEAILTYEPAGEKPKRVVQVSSSVRANFADYKRLVIDSVDHEVVRAVVSHDIAESIQLAIGFADEGKLEKGIREIKGTLRDLKGLNYDLEDGEVEKSIVDLENYIQSLESRGLDRIDRKVMTLKVFQAIQQRSSRSVSEESEKLAAETQ